MNKKEKHICIRERILEIRNYKNGTNIFVMFLFSAVLCLLYFQKFFPILISIFLVVFSSILFRFLPLPIGLEFVTLSVFLVSRLFSGHTIISLIFGIFLLSLSIIIVEQEVYKRLPSFVGIFVIWLFFVHVKLFFSYGLTGLVASLLFDVVVLPLYKMFGAKTPNIFVFSITHLFLNFMIFKNFAPLLLSL